MKKKINEIIKSLIEEERYDEIPKIMENENDRFWSEIYPEKTYEQRINYWSSSLHQQMRWNGESGVDPMAVFSKNDYKSWKIKEPMIDEILVSVIKKLNLNADEVFKELKN